MQRKQSPLRFCCATGTSWAIFSIHLRKIAIFSIFVPCNSLTNCRTAQTVTLTESTLKMSENERWLISVRQLYVSQKGPSLARSY